MNIKVSKLFLIFIDRSSLDACSNISSCSSNDKNKQMRAQEKSYEKSFINFSASDPEGNDHLHQDFSNSWFGGCEFTEIKRMRLDSSENVSMQYYYTNALFPILNYNCLFSVK